MRFLDYGYSEKGHMLFNFGKEGESYEMKDGNPVYTDLILHNPDGLSVSDSMKKYLLAMNSGPFVQDEKYIEQYYQYQQQKDAVDICRLSTQRLIIFLWQVSEYSPRNRAYTSQCTRLPIYKLSLISHSVISYDIPCIGQVFFFVLLS